MAKLKYTFTNTLPVEETVAVDEYDHEGLESTVNAGAKTGPYGNGLRFNDIALPLPRTNLQIILVAGADALEIETEDIIEQAFFAQFVADEDGEVKTEIRGLTATVETVSE